MATSPVSLLISAGDSTERSGVMNPSTNWMSQPTITYLETTLPSDYLFTEEDDEFYINPSKPVTASTAIYSTFPSPVRSQDSHHHISIIHDCEHSHRKHSRLPVGDSRTKTEASVKLSSGEFFWFLA